MVFGPTPRSSPLTLVALMFFLLLGPEPDPPPWSGPTVPDPNPNPAPGSPSTHLSSSGNWNYELPLLLFFGLVVVSVPGTWTSTVHSFASKGHTRQDLCLALVILQQKLQKKYKKKILKK